MKTLYISRLGKEFIGGADNLSNFLVGAFIKKLNLLADDISYGVQRNSFEELKDLDHYDLIIAESSALPSTDDLLKLSDETLSKMHVFMHSAFLAQENDLSDGVLGPSAWDVKDATGILELFHRGLTPYYGSMNHARVVNILLREDKAQYLDLSKFRSKNMNLEYPKIDNSIRKDNAVLFATGYYHPGVGIHLLMKMLENPASDAFEWYIVGRPFSTYYRITDKKLWKDAYEEVINKPNVHLVEFTRDLSYYYRLCKFNLVLSKSDSYSFKALEALSHGCINVTTEWNCLLPWSSYSILIREYRDLDIYAEEALKTLKWNSKFEPDFPDSLEKVLEEYSEYHEFGVPMYLSSLLSDVLFNTREFLYDSDIEKSYWKYNRLK